MIGDTSTSLGARLRNAVQSGACTAPPSGGGEPRNVARRLRAMRKQDGSDSGKRSLSTSGRTRPSEKPNSPCAIAPCTAKSAPTAK